MRYIDRESGVHTPGASRARAVVGAGAVAAVAVFGAACADPAMNATGPAAARSATPLVAAAPGTHASKADWIARPAMPTPLTRLAAASVNNVVYAIGGVDAGGVVQPTVRAFNPSSGAWTARAPLPNGRADADGATAIGSTIYLPGGRGPRGTFTRSLFAYNAGSNSWTTKAQIPVAGGCGGSVALGALLYVGHGCSAAGTPDNAFFSYNPSTNTWKTLNTPADYHKFGRLFVAGGNIYWMGGRRSPRWREGSNGTMWPRTRGRLSATCSRSAPRTPWGW